MKINRVFLGMTSTLICTLYGAMLFAQNDAQAEQQTVAKELKALQQKIEAQDKKIEQQNKKIETQDAELKAISDAQKKQEEQLETAAMDRDDLAMQVMDAAAAATDEKFTISGFMDLSFTHQYTAKKNNYGFADVSSRYNSFYQTGVNLYFKSQMTETLSALAEIRFSYSPLGQINELPNRVIVNGKEVTTIGEYNRTSTYADYQYEGGVNLGGVNIERAHVDWKPRDWFGIRAGRYLTPFGIWNEDHGAPVVLTVALPYLISFEVAPVAQTGLMLFGKVFPSDLLTLEYALTLSNGRSPTESFVDTDHNKAIGLRTKGILAGSDWSVQLGSYGYYGKYTDRQTEVLSIVEGTSFEMEARDVIIQKYKEFLGTLDMKATWKGLSIFGEAGILKKDQIVPLEALDFLGRPSWEPTYYQKSGYGMVAYQLPLQKVFDTLTITPFAGIDYLNLIDAMDDTYFVVYRFGINFKPSPFVTVKTNAFQVNLKSPGFELPPTWFFKGQIAVSF